MINPASNSPAAGKIRLVAITGASGFIGKLLVQECLAKGLLVRVLTRNTSKLVANPSLQVFVGDLTTTTDWSDFVRDVDVLIHCAAEIKDPLAMQAVNVDGAARLLQASVGQVRRWVQLSSVGAYGVVSSGLITEDSPENPLGPYEVTKTVFDRMLRETAATGSIEVVLLRPSNVYGIEMSNQSLFQMVYMIKRGLFCFIGGKGASANYVHVIDVVRALIICAEHPAAQGKIFNLSDWTTMEEMVATIAKSMQVRVPSFRLPLFLAMGLAKSMQWWSRSPLTVSRVRALSSRARYSSQRIEYELGFQIQTPIVVGVFDLKCKK